MTPKGGGVWARTLEEPISTLVCSQHTQKYFLHGAWRRCVLRPLDLPLRPLDLPLRPLDLPLRPLHLPLRRAANRAGACRKRRRLLMVSSWLLHVLEYSIP